MLFNKINSFNYSGSTVTNNNTSAAITNFGKTIISGNAGIKGAWTSIMPTTFSYIDPGDSLNSTLSKDIYMIEILIGRSGSNDAILPCIADFGVDPAGGSNYQIKIKDLIVGAVNDAYLSANMTYRFPIFIKAGSSVAMRMQSKTTGTRQVRVGLKFWGLPTNKESIFTGSYIETIGQSVDAGTAITLGTTAYGAWSTLGVTTKKICYWNLGIACDNASMGGRNFYFNLAHGNTKKNIIGNMRVVTSNVESVGFYNVGAYHVVPAGTTIYAQGFGAVNQTGFSVIAYGVG